jgi:hypothetical protein
MTPHPSFQRRSTLRASRPTRSRSRSSPSAARTSTGCSSSSSRWARRKSAGSSSTRRRMSQGPSRQARYSSPTSRLVKWCFAIDSDRASQSSRFARARGTRYFIAAWAGIRPARMCSCTERGRTWTSPSRWDTHPTLRSNCFARSSRLRGRFRSSWSSQACSIAVSESAARRARSRTRASASLMSHTVAQTVSCPRRRSSRTRLCPSIT